jgi:hypothetical protein
MTLHVAGKRAFNDAIPASLIFVLITGFGIFSNIMGLDGGKISRGSYRIGGLKTRHQPAILFSMGDAVIAASWGAVAEEAGLNFVFDVLLWACVFALAEQVAAEGALDRIRKVRIRSRLCSVRELANH